MYCLYQDLFFYQKKLFIYRTFQKDKDILYQKKYLGHYGHIKQMNLFSNKKKK